MIVSKYLLNKWTDSVSLTSFASFWSPFKGWLNAIGAFFSASPQQALSRLGMCLLQLILAFCFVFSLSVDVPYLSLWIIICSMLGSLVFWPFLIFVLPSFWPRGDDSIHSYQKDTLNVQAEQCHCQGQAWAVQSSLRPGPQRNLAVSLWHMPLSLVLSCLMRELDQWPLRFLLDITCAVGPSILQEEYGLHLWEPTVW